EAAGDRAGGGAGGGGVGGGGARVRGGFLLPAVFRARRDPGQLNRPRARPKDSSGNRPIAPRARLEASDFRARAGAARKTAGPVALPDPHPKRSPCRSSRSARDRGSGAASSGNADRGGRRSPGLDVIPDSGFEIQQRLWI